MVMEPKGAAAAPDARLDGSPGQGRDADPLPDLVRHLRGAYGALRLNLSMLLDELLSRLYQELFAMLLVIIGMLCALVVTVMGAYLLVHGVALALEELTGRAWLGQLITGAIFVLLPLIATWVTSIILQAGRSRRLLRKYAALQHAAERR